MKTRTKAVPNSKYKTDDRGSKKGGNPSKKPASSKAVAETSIQKKKKGRPPTKNLTLRKQILVEKKNPEPNLVVDKCFNSMECDPVNKSEFATKRPSTEVSDGANHENRCTICVKRFDCLDLYKFHMRTRHPKEKTRSHHKQPSPKPYACQKCDAKFKTSDRLNQHIAQHHPIIALGPRDLSAVQEYFESLVVHDSARIMREIETVFKHTNKFVSCLNTEASLENVSNYDQLLRTHRTLLERQLEIYEAASALLSVKRDSLKFAFEDWMQKHNHEPVEVEDYNTFPMGVGLNLELSSDGTIVTNNKKCTVEPITNGETTKVPIVMRDMECQTTIQGSDLQLSDCLNDDQEYEFLDSKTGIYFTNKVKEEPEPEPEPEPEIKFKHETESELAIKDEPVNIPNVDYDEEMVELIEVEDDFEEEDAVRDDKTMEIASICESLQFPLAPIKAISMAPTINKKPPTKVEAQAVNEPLPLANHSPLPSQIRNALLDVEPNARGLYKCIKCTYTSSASARLIPHYKQTHLRGGINSKPCTHCDRLFIDAEDLRKHMQSVHLTITNAAQFPCRHPKCTNISFRTTQELHLHITRVHPAPRMNANVVKRM